MSTNSIIQRAKHALRNYGPNSNVHGLYHFFRAHNKVQKIIWLSILIAACVVMTIHMSFSIIRYLNSDTFVHITDDGKDARFPDVTICNLRPVVESIIINDQLYEKLLNYLDSRWSRFLPWLKALGKSDFGDPLKNRTLFRPVWQKVMEIFWASEDTFEFSMVDKLGVLDCKYESTPCRNQFKLVRHPIGWSCYSFEANKAIAVGSKGLELVLFTEGAFIHEISVKPPIAVYNLTIDNLLKGTDSGGKFARYFKYSWLLDFNGLGNYVSDGIRVIIHDHKTHPMLSPHQLKFHSGESVVVGIDELIVKKQKRSVADCQMEPYATVQYVTGFETKGGDPMRKTYFKLFEEKLTEATQSKVYRECRCYSHRYPFSASVEDLCYFIPEEQRRTPSLDLLEKRIKCHDKALDTASSEYKEWTKSLNFINFSACETSRFTFTTNSYSWPRNSDIRDVVNKHVWRHFTNLSTYRWDQERNKKSKDCRKMLASRGETILNTLFFNGSECDSSNLYNGTWCLKASDRLRQNMVKLQIKMLTPKSRLASDYPRSDWPEILSEIGGICGLWLGFSLITIVELVEMAWLIVLPSIESKAGCRDSSETNSWKSDPED